MNTAGLENHPLVIMPIGMIMRFSLATLSGYRVGGEKVKVCIDPGLKARRIRTRTFIVNHYLILYLELAGKNYRKY